MRFSILAVLVIRLIGPMVVCSGADALTIAWGDLRNVVGSRPVLVEVEHTARIQGMVAAQEGDVAVISVTGTSAAAMYPKNEVARIPRSKITRLRVVKNPQQVGWRVAGTIGGYFAGTGLAVLAGGGEQNPGVLAGMAAGLVGGYYWGRTLDKQTMEIHFLDSRAAAPTPGSQARQTPSYLLPMEAGARP